jgi:aminoglycoside phosphotransferase
VRWPDGEQAQILGASTGALEVDAGPGVVSLSRRGREVAVWRLAHDPDLPSLGAAADPHRLAAVLASLGVPGLGPAGEPVGLRVRAYRPRRRAVLEVSAPGGPLFVKAVRPDRVEALHRRHALLHEAGLPVPRSLGWTDSGLLALQALPGHSLRRALRTRDAHIPTADDLSELLDRLPPALLDLPHRQSWSAGARHYARVIGAVLPREAGRARDLADEIAEGVAGHPADQPAHGDLHEAHLLLTGRRVSGLLDVDSAGPGRRADDLACLVAHAEVLATTDHRHRDRLRRQARDWARDGTRDGTREATRDGSADTGGTVEPRELRLRVAGVVLSLATGPHRMQTRGWEHATAARLDVAERWLEWARA